jgi:acyl dehydratase
MTATKTARHAAQGESPGVSFSSEIGHRTITVADLVAFGGATGDYARMHFDHTQSGESTDADAAESASARSARAGAGTTGAKDFEGRGTIAPGLLSASWALGALAWSAPERLGIGDPDLSIAAYSIRFERSMCVGDRLSLRHAPAVGAAVAGLAAEDGHDTDFEVLNQRGERTCRGAVSVRAAATAFDSGVRGAASGWAPPRPMPRPVPPQGSGPRPLYADDLLEFGPRGESIGRSVSEADVVGFTNLTAERNPLYLNRVFAAQGRFGSRIAPPIWTFCLAFGDFLHGLLACELPSTGLAGHLGDSFRCHAPVHLGDTIRTRHQPVRCTPSRGRPDMSVVHFAIELLNQDDVLVQDGEVAMWIPSRALPRGKGLV